MLNPITYSENVVSDFLRYQLTTYPLADQRLYEQLRALLSLEHTRQTPLLRGPYVSLSRSFRAGKKVSELVAEKLLHPHIQALSPYANVYGHQETAFEAIAKKKTTLVSTGTGSGKTECFLYPIISHCLKLRDEGAPEGISAVLVYPMNALAEDQLGRLRSLLTGSGVTFGMYVGKTPEKAADAAGLRLDARASRGDYEAAVRRMREDKRHQPVLPPEERASREEMRERGKRPRILLTNVKQLELLLTRQRDVELFDGARLEFLVFDEAHTFSGAAGAETACLIRRLRSFCGKTPEQTVCIATSATIADPERGAEAGREFASRFFGVREENVALVGEEYEKDVWAEKRTVSGPLPGDPAIQLQTVLEAVRGVEKDVPTKQDLQVLKTAFQAMTGSSLDLRRWQESLHERLAANEIVYQIAEALKIAKPLSDLVKELEARFGRPVPEEEIVAWLALGAASRCEGRPLLRPVVHGFIRGLGGAVVSFPKDLRGPKLWLSREDAAIGEAEGEKLVHLDLTTCTTCGQHYFAHFVADFTFFARAPGGGEAVEDRVVWRPLEAKAGGRRVVLLDRLISGDDDVDEADEPRNTASVYLCRRCGALHPNPIERCDGCGERGALVSLFAVQQKEPTEKEGSEKAGKLTVCVSCRAQGRSKPGGYREPARPVRAQNVSDVHVLAQSMLQHSERPRLLIFTDNRQDAAFQAGWMQDHARRFRLRSLMYEQILKGPISVGDLTGALDDLLEPDDDLSQALIPEVWRAERKETSGIRHSAERKRFLRIQVLREIVTGARQRLGLEPWGRMMVEYDGLTPDLPFFQSWASRIGCAAEALRDGVATLLDLNRRAAILYDRDLRLYSRFWPDGAKEIQRGYFPAMPGGPKGLKLRRAANDEPSRVKQLVSARGATTARLLARRWGLTDDQLEPFFDDLWKLLTGPLALLVPVNLTGWNEKVLPGCSEVTQIDADRLRIVAHRGFFRCALCRRTNLRPTPRMACTGRSCTGMLTQELENADNYDLMVLDQGFVMIRPREHSAQIPADEREILERAFKGDSQLTNTLVCTPTLELGVDIGALDSVLMRNVPPLPANYWQRAGRAGRRHRMAVNLTYARSASHDRAYFADPLKLLHGLVQPPRFNLKNEPMVRKHVHATMLTVLHRLASTTAAWDGHEGGRESLSLADREAVTFALEQCIPTQIKTYLFDAADNVRTSAFDVGPLARVISRHEAWLLHEVKAAFTQEWPAKDSAVVEPDVLRATIANMAEGLAEVIARLEQRLRWALDQMRRLDSVRAHKGTLDPDEDALRARCDRLIKRLKGQQSRARRDAEGYDDTYTYAVLSAEGFLPGYGLDVGAVVGFHQAARYGTGMRDWELRRALPLAVREYVPGNLIYANGHRFLPRFYHLVALEEPTLFQVDLTNGAVSEAGLGADAAVVGLGATALAAVPICDVDLPHQSHITDEEDYRFQLPVTVYGYEQPRHGGGKAFAWGERVITCRTSVHLRLVNVGPTSGVREGHLGYPLCLVCGQSRSPLASKKDKEAFSIDHQQRCGRPVTQVGFYADVIADALAIDGCADLTEAYSVAEALRKGAAEVLEIEIGDLQLLVVGRAGELARKVLIYDPMPGGSGLLDQLVSRWAEIVREAHDLLVSCRSACASACVDCLLNYRNSFYHAHLDRHVAADLLESRGGALMVTHDIPPLLPLHLGTGQPVNQAESSLRYMLERAGFHNARPQHAIDLGKPLGVTTPDFFFADVSERTDGICLYLDGMSQALHGNPATQTRDRAIREELRNRSYEVLEITYGQLSDQAAMREKFWRLARMLMGKDRATKIREDASWFEEAVARHASDHPPPSLGSGWNEILALLDEAWIPLATGLRDAQVPVPDNAHDDILVDGRVSTHKAILMWAQAAPFVALIDSELAFDEKHGRLFRVSPDSDPLEVAAALIERLGGGR
jgi:RAD3-like DEAD/DEAH box helicase/uncharacterized protein DUF1998/helicase-like protein